MQTSLVGIPSSVSSFKTNKKRSTAVSFFFLQNGLKTGREPKSRGPGSFPRLEGGGLKLPFPSSSEGCIWYGMGYPEGELLFTILPIEFMPPSKEAAQMAGEPSGHEFAKV